MVHRKKRTNAGVTRNLHPARIAISGKGLAAPLAACCISACWPDAAIDLYCYPSVSEHGLEPVLMNDLSPAIREVVEAIAVCCWEAVAVVAEGHNVRLPAHVALIDPVQLALEVDCRRDRIAIHRGSMAEFPESGTTLHLQIDEFAVPLAGSNLLEAEAIMDLAVPVLADFDIARSRGLILQYFPLACGRVLVRQMPLGGLVLDKANPAASIMRHCAMANRAIEQAACFAASHGSSEQPDCQ